MDSAVASDPRLRPTGRSRRLRERVAAFQTAKRASHSQLKDTVAEFEAVLDDILEQMPPSPGFASSSSTSGAVASRTGSLARSETVGGGMVDLELQRQRSVLIKEDEAAHEWRAHLRTQVDLIRRLWRRFRDNNLVRFQTHAPEYTNRCRLGFSRRVPGSVWLCRSPFHCLHLVQRKRAHHCHRRK